MTTLRDDLHDVHPARQLVGIGLAVAITIPAIALSFSHSDLPDPLQALLFGVAIVGSAFLLSWAAEAAQLDISAGLAIAILALIAVLPEYAVDFVFAWKGGEAFEAANYTACPPPPGGVESPCSLALANMTGANRLLIGVGWTMVVFVAFYRLRRLGRIQRGRRWKGVQLDRDHAIELSYLAVATVYSLSLPLKHSVTLIDAAILVDDLRPLHRSGRTSAGRGAAPGRSRPPRRRAPHRRSPERLHRDDGRSPPPLSC